ncbi:ATP-grasp domain-containing protein, partial [Parabacteroides goldsteinii]
RSPEKIFHFRIDPLIGIPDYLARRYAFTLFDKIAQVNQMAAIIRNMYRLFIEKDASLVEINPLVMTKDGVLMAI